MRNHIEKFLVLFSRLKSELNNSLPNLKWLPKAKPEIKETIANNREMFLQIATIVKQAWEE